MATPTDSVSSETVTTAIAADGGVPPVTLASKFSPEKFIEKKEEIKKVVSIGYKKNYKKNGKTLAPYLPFHYKPNGKTNVPLRIEAKLKSVFGVSEWIDEATKDKKYSIGFELNHNDVLPPFCAAMDEVCKEALSKELKRLLPKKAYPNKEAFFGAGHYCSCEKQYKKAESQDEHGSRHVLKFDGKTQYYLVNKKNKAYLSKDHLGKDRPVSLSDFLKKNEKGELKGIRNRIYTVLYKLEILNTDDKDHPSFNPKFVAESIAMHDPEDLEAEGFSTVDTSEVENHHRVPKTEDGPSPGPDSVSPPAATPATPATAAGTSRLGSTSSSMEKKPLLSLDSFPDVNEDSSKRKNQAQENDKLEPPHKKTKIDPFASFE